MAKIELIDESPLNVTLSEPQAMDTNVNEQDSVNVTSTDGWYEIPYNETDPIFSESVASTITNENIENWNNKSDFSGDYNDLENKPTIPEVPTKTSDLVNDSGFLTEHQDISGKVDKVNGKGLSTNDFTDTYKSNVDSNTSARHTHNNKSVLDDISSNDVSNWDSKQETLVSGTNIKTINNESILGSGNITIQGGSGENAEWGNIGGTLTDQTDLVAALNEKAKIYYVLSNNNNYTYNQIKSLIDDGYEICLRINTSGGSGFFKDSVGNLTRFTSSYMQFAFVWTTDSWTYTYYFSNNEWDINYYGLADFDSIPTKVSDLTNDSGFITSYTETDPTVPNHVKSITSTDITNWNNKSTFSGSYNDLSDKPTIPTKTSDITNDSGFITSTNYASNQTGGTIKTDTSTYGTSMYSGYLTGSTRTYTQYGNAANALFVSKGTLENVITGKGLVSNNDLSTVATSGSYTDLTNKPTIPTNNNQLANGAGYITGITSSDVTTALGYIPEQKEMFWLNSTFAYDLSDLESITSTSDDLFIDIKDAIDNEKSFEIKTNDGLTGDVAFVKAVNCEHLARYNTRPESYSFWYMVDDTLYKIQFTINGTSVTTTTTSYSKQDSLISGTNIKTINNESLLGSGDISFETIQEISGESSIWIKNLDAGIYKIYGETYGTDVYYNSNDSLIVADLSYAYLIVIEVNDIQTSRHWVYIGNLYNEVCYGISCGSYGYCYNITSAEEQAAITGILSNLTTTAKTNLVSAINELDSDKQDTLVSGTNIKTINNTSLLGSGNISINTMSDAADYVTECDTDGTWTWRKWKSGWVELFAFHQFTGLNITTSSGGTYYGANGDLTLPFTLTELYAQSGQLGGAVSSGIYPYKIYTINSGTKLRTEFRAHASSSNASCGIKYYLIGVYDTNS